MDNGNEMSSSLTFASSSYLSNGSSSQNLSAAATGCSNLDNLSLNKLSANLEKLLIDSEYEYSDAEIVVEDIPVGVHRSILAARSQFFHQLFKRGNGGEVKEGKPRYSMSDLVPYGRVGYEAFNVFLSYLYTGKLKPSPPEVSTCVDDDCAHDACRPAINYAVELMYASATFQMKELVLVVQRRLLNFVDKALVEDVIPILVAAFHCQLNQLLSHCIHRVERSDLDNISIEKELPYEVSKEIISLRLKSQQEAELIVPEVVMDPLHEKRIRRIHKALDSDDVELVKMLLNESTITLDEAYALHYAAAYCDPKIVKEVLNLDLADLNCRNGRGYTILHVAARRKEPSILVALLHKGASASERTLDGRTAVTICRRLTRPKDYNEKTNQGQESNKDKLCIDVLEREMRGSSISVNMAISSQVIADDLNMKLHYYENRANTQSMAASQSHATRLPPSNPFEDVLSWPKMWAKLTANPATRTDLQNKDFVRIMHELHNIYLKDKRVIQALGVLLNISFWMPTSADTEMPESLSLLSLPLEWKKGTEAKPAKELDLMELKAEEGMDKEPQAFKEQELDNAAYDKNDLDTVIGHYTKVMELGDGDISCLINRAIAYLAMGQYEECINDCDKAVERGRQLKSDSKMIEIALTTKGTALVKMAKLSKDNVPTIETYQKTLSEHRNPDALKKLNDAKEVKRELEQHEYLDTKLANEEHEKDNSSIASREASVSSFGNQSQPLNPTTKKSQCLLGMPDPDVEVIALSPKTLLATNKFVCEICNKGFKREQNLQLHWQGHYLSWKPSQRSSKDVKKVYVCPEPSCVHHDPSRALGDLMGIKKHFCRKHSKKKWKCNKCSKKYTIWSDWKAHSKICGTRVYKCDCGTLFSRKDSFITHRVFCDALAEVSARAQTQPVVNPNSKSDTKIQAVDNQGQSYSPSWLFKNLHNTPLNPNPGSVSTVDSSPPTPAPARAQARLAHPQSTGVISLVLPIESPEETSENEIASEHHGMEIDIEEVKMTDSSEQKKFEIEEIGNEASQTRQPDVIQVEDMQLQASSTLKPQRVLFDVNEVNILKSSGLMQSQIEEVEMKSEAREQRGFFLMQGGLGLIMPPKDEDWKNAKEIYLMDNELSILPENRRCPNLSALFLPRNYKLRTIPPSFFDHMPALQILNLSRTSIKLLPDSIIKLISLKRLFLNNCHRLMTLSPKVGDLKLLEVLDLEGTKIMDLPMEIKELTNLKCLEVSFYGYMSNGRRAMQSNAVVPCVVISALSQLEELNIDVNPDDARWDACVEDIVTEVCSLKRLETLKFYFPRVELLRHFQWNSLQLSHFRFTVGHHVKRIMSRVPCDVEFELERWEKCLKYINGVGVPGDIKKVLQHAVAFFLDRHATVKKLSDFGLRNMKQLKCCVMGECNEVQVIVDEADADKEDDTSKIVSDSFGTERIVLGSLEYLYIYYMKNLRSIWEGSVQKNSLFLLKSLTLRTCPQLTTIFTQGLLDNLCNLEELKVEDCPSIKSIVSCEVSAEHRTSYFLPNLKKISLHYMPGLVSIFSGLHIAPKLEWLSFYNCPDLKNPLIDEISSQDLKKIKGERSWWEALEWSNGCPSYLEEIFVPIDIQDC